MHAYITTFGRLALVSASLLIVGCNDELSTEPHRVPVMPTKPSANLLSAPQINPVFHTNAHEVVSQVPNSTGAHASASMTWNGPTPTGTLTFRWYHDGACDWGTAIFEPTVALDANAQAHPSTWSLNAERVYGLRVEYSGDANYPKASSACVVLNASGKQLPSISMDLHNSTEVVLDEVPTGSSVHPKAFATGTNGTPTGFFGFRFYWGDSCMGTPDLAPSQGAVLDASGGADGFVAMIGPVSGTFAYQATYFGDDTYALVAGPCRVFTTVAKQVTAATLEIHNDNHDITSTFPTLSAIHGKVTLTGNPAPSGSIQIKRYPNATCQGQWTSATTTQISNGVIDPLGTVGAGAVGTTSFNATYAGSDTYISATTNCVTVTVVENRLMPTVTGELHNEAHQAITTSGTNGSVHAKGFVSGTGPTPTGQVVTYAYMNATCAGDVSTASPVALDVSGAADIINSVIGGGYLGNTYSMRVRYYGDEAYQSAWGPCMTYTIVAQTITVKLGSVGYWRNWRNKYSADQLQQLIDAMKTSYAPVFNKDGIANNTDDLTSAKVDAIYLFPKKPTTEQQLLAHFTSLAFDLALTQLAPTGLPKPNDSICGAAALDVSSIAGAAALLGTSSPTVAQVMSFAAQRWTGTFSASKVDWSFNLSKAELDTLLLILSKINDSSIIVNNGC